MHTLLPRFGLANPLLAACLVWIAGAFPAGSAQAAPGPTPDRIETVVQETCRQIVQGHFTVATEAIAAIPREGVSDERVAQLRSWLDDYGALTRQREANRAKEFKRYVKEARTLIAELEDAEYEQWMIGVYRAYGYGIDHGAKTAEETTDDETDRTNEDEDAESAARKARFAAAVDANLEPLESATTRERYRGWAMADFERFEDTRLGALAALAVNQPGPVTRSTLVGLYHASCVFRAAQRVRAAVPQPCPGVGEYARRLRSMLDGGPNTAQHAHLVDTAFVTGMLNDARTWLIGELAAEIVTAGRPHATLGRVVDELYSQGEALLAAQRAMVHAADEDAFRETPWVVELAATSAEYARKRMTEFDWGQAMRLYAGLETLFPKRKDYREKREECVDHVRLTRFYAPTRKWEEQLRGIDPEMTRNAIEQIERNYVEKPDFAKVLSAGLRALLLLVETDSLPKVFPSLSDEFRAAMFAARIKTLRDQIKPDQALTGEDVIARFDRVLKINEQTIDLPTSVIVSEFTNAALDPLDRFTSVIWPAEVQEFRKRTIGQFSGVGIQIMMKDGWLTVVQPLEDTPAYRAGIAPDDVITKIDGQSTENIFIEEAVKKITGPQGTEVVLTIRSPDGSERDVPIKRTTIEIKTVKGDHRDDAGKWEHFIDREHKIAYVRVTSFTEKTVDELRRTQETLADRGAQGLILDLRFNPGGLLRSAVDMADLYLSGNKKIVSTKGQNSKPWSESATDGRCFPDLPLIVLINDRSASASEIVAGALQDNDNRALTLGERTFGKGSVQNLIPIGDGRAYLKLTTAHYYLPSGRLVHRQDDSDTWGVDPDIPVKLVPGEVRTVIKLQRKFDVLQGRKRNEAAAAEAPPDAQSSTTQPSDTADDELKVDPQIETALLVMRAHLLSRKPWSATARIDARSAKTQ